MTTLGRGGSDTTAVAIAGSAAGKSLRDLYGREGVYTADPELSQMPESFRKCFMTRCWSLRHWEQKSFTTVQVEMAKKYGVELVVLSSLTRAEGTVVKEETKVERMLVSGVAVDKNTARISVLGVKNEPGIAFRIFNMLAKNQINVDIIIQSVGREDKKDISFTVARTDLAEAYGYSE